MERGERSRKGGERDGKSVPITGGISMLLSWARKKWNGVLEPRGDYVLIPNGREEENSTVPSRVCPFACIGDGIVQTALIRLICYLIATVVLQTLLTTRARSAKGQ